ncbi:MAG: hypothetical protein ACYC96_02600 [Fimbriimonadaceae bacterium]
MNQELDTRAFKRLLNEIADLCEHASLTGSMASGASRTAERYNAVLKTLTDADSIPAGLFSPVSEGADFGEIGVEARMLAGYVCSDPKHKGDNGGGDGVSVIVRLAPFIGQAELGQLVRQQARNGAALDINTITALAPFLAQEQLSEIVRETMLHSDEPAAKQEPTATPQAKMDTTPVPVVNEEQGIGPLLDMLEDPSLSEGERKHVIDRIRIARG